MHVHHTNQAMPMQHLVEMRQTPAAREAETKRKLSLFLAGAGEDAGERRGGRREREEGSRKRQSEDEGEFVHAFSVTA